MVKDNAIRVTKNTIFLYIRMVFLTFISLYTVKQILLVLGESDYGLYNVVGGIVTMFTFISGMLTNASERYFSLYLYNDDWNKVNKFYSMNLVIYIFVIVICIVAFETIGVWFLYNKMTIETGRMTVAYYVFQLSIITFILNLIISPYKALLISTENMKIYSYISIFEGLGKLLIVFLVKKSNFDKLLCYAILLAITSVIVDVLHIVYCKLKYKKLHFVFQKNAKEYIDLFQYIGWNFMGAVATIFKGQGINILLNVFFNTILNTARGIANQVSSVVNSFSQNFLKAISPQITKKYASKANVQSIILISSKISYYLLFVIMMPLILNVNCVFEMWLSKIPTYSIELTKLMLIDCMVSSITDPLDTAIKATGKIKWYQIILGGTNLLNVPFAYILLLKFNNPLYPFYAAIVISTVMLLLRIIIYYKRNSTLMFDYFYHVVLPIIFISFISLIIGEAIYSDAETFLKLVTNVIISIVINIPLIFCFGLSRNEKNIVFSLILESKIVRNILHSKL